MREFDLNIERVLENWSVAHALREIIANALDEQALTGTREPVISSDDQGRWHIRDWGRGLRYEHLTQNENREKLASPEKVIGKFGVGLKDALATFDRHRITVTVLSRYGDITIGRVAKHGFPDLKTLHALVSPPSDAQREGTDFILHGRALGVAEIDEAKSLFLHYSGDKVAGSTAYGTVLERTSKAAPGRIYVNGLRVAEEDNFLFSYNITSPTTKLRQALNRERSNVGRTAYTDRIKAILLACTEDAVIDAVVSDLELYANGEQHDETQWIDVGVHACKQLNARNNVIFLSAMDLAQAPDFLQRAADDGYRTVVVPQTLSTKLPQLKDASGNPIRDLTRYREEWNSSFQFTFTDPADLTLRERAVWDALPLIFAARGGRPSRVKQVRISETMRLTSGSYQEAVGLWDPADGSIIVKRSQLQTLAEFAGTVLHEISHSSSGAPDVSLAFEHELTEETGRTVARLLSDPRAALRA